jgi:ABC-type amino acid transport substrate-binding protein
MAINFKQLTAWRNGLFSLLALIGCFAICTLTIWAFRKDLTCRDAASQDECRAQFGNTENVRRQEALKKIYIAAGLVPPNMKEDRSGREADIITTALAIGDAKTPQIKKEQIQFVVEPFGRHWYSYETDKRFDAVTTVPGFMRLDGHASRYYILYRNGIGSLPSRGISGSPPNKTLEQLEGKRVVSFPGAARVLPEIRSLRDNYFSLFVERQDQRDHSLMLLTGQVDAVIADAMVFSHFNERLLKEKAVRHQPAPVFTEAFAPTCYKMVFRNAEYRDLFDDGLKKMIASGRLREIDDDYTKSSNLNVEYVGADGAPRCQD